jgi:hypothetical protein
MSKKVLELFPCKCCGNSIIIEITDNFIDVSCSDKSIIDPCVNYNSICEKEKKSCFLNDNAIIKQEDLLFEQIINMIKGILRDTKENNCYVFIDTRRIQILLNRILSQTWHYYFFKQDLGFLIYIFEENYDKSN